MLNINNWPGLIEKIESGGYQINQVNNMLVGVRKSDNVTGVIVDNEIETIINNFTVQDSATFVCQKIEALATKKRNIVIAPFSAGEMSSWPIKRAEATLYNQTLNSSDAPYLSNEAAIRGVTLSTLVSKVITDATRFSNIEAAIAGTSGRHRDTVKSFTTFEQVMTYDYTTGWPV